MTIIPLFSCVEVKPIEKDSGPFKIVDAEFEEMGEVVSVSNDISVGPTALVAVGDIIFYYGHTVFETPEIDGVRHYFVPMNPESVFAVMKKDAVASQ